MNTTEGKAKATAKFWMVVHPKDGLMHNGGIWATEDDATKIMGVLGGTTIEKLKAEGWRVAKVWIEEMG